MTGELTGKREAARAEGRGLGDRLQDADDPWRAAGDAGLFAALVPGRPDIGGRPFGEGCALLEGLGEAGVDLGFLLAVAAHTWGAIVPLIEAGEDAAALLAGHARGAHAVSEPEAGSDVAGMQTTLSGDPLRLVGHKTWVTNAPDADVVLVYARDGDGLSVVRVDPRAGGVTVAPLAKTGLRGASMGSLTLDLEVDPAWIVGRRGSGMAQFTSALEWERASIGAALVGAMQRGLDRCVAHARRRRQFGAPIGAFQAVAHRIVGMKLRVETSRLLLYRAADAKERGRAPVEASEAKLAISEAAVANSLDAVSIFGAAGYLAEAEEARRLADVVGMPLLSGTSDIQRNLIARFLGLPSGRR